MTDTLKPCPFCGGEPKYIPACKSAAHPGQGWPDQIVHDCPLTETQMLFRGNSEQDVTRKWNMRSAHLPDPGDKYSEVLNPFLKLMEKELHANAGKGDRPGWLSMTPETAMLEIYYHVAKLQRAVKNEDLELIKEHSADVANMSMMMADIFGQLSQEETVDA